MGFRCGIVGLPNVGKSTLFNALTETAAAQAANYPFCTIEPNVGNVGVPDPRLQKLAAIAGEAPMAGIDSGARRKIASAGTGVGVAATGRASRIVVGATETGGTVRSGAAPAGAAPSRANAGCVARPRTSATAPMIVRMGRPLLMRAAAFPVAVPSIERLRHAVAPAATFGYPAINRSLRAMKR